MMLPETFAHDDRSKSRLYWAQILALALLLAVAALPGGTRAQSAAPAAPAQQAQITSARPDVAAFRGRVDAALATGGADKGYWGLVVSDADTGEVLYALNAQRYFTPASNTKLFTTALVLATMGPDFRFHTTLETIGTLTPGGTLRGDLVLVGRGDPNLSNRKFPYEKKEERDGPPEKVLAELADAAVAHGLKQIEGGIVADDSYFDYERYPSGWSIDDMLWGYGAPVSALCINDNTFDLELRSAEREGALALFSLEPWAGFYKIQNEVRTGPASSEPKLSIAREPGSRTITLQGTLPLNSQPAKRTLAIEEPAEYAAALLKRLLEERGVRIYGEARARHSTDAVNPADSAAAPSTLVLAEHVSPPLMEDVRLLLKISQNLHAELLLRVAVRWAIGLTSTDAALKFAQDFRTRIGINENDALLSDGSGLSRRNLVTPEATVKLLAWIARQPWGDPFRSALPVAGDDGTLSERMKNPPLLDRIQAKTGSLGHVNALSGYATTLRGEKLIFSMFGNNNALRGHDATEVMDAICAAMIEELGTHAPAAGGTRRKSSP